MTVIRILLFFLLLCLSALAFAQENSAVNDPILRDRLKTVASLFQAGRYESTIEELKALEVNVAESDSANETRGLISYWKGICYNRLQNFPEAIESFELSLKQGYRPVDIHYEYGQALFAAEKLREARLQFRESLKRKFKRAISLYYVAFLSAELGEKRKAHAFYKAISKLPPDEVSDVQQATEMQLGDIYQEKAEGRADAFQTVDAVVIPQYKKALAIDPDSGLAPLIQEKITKLQRKYELVLFQLRNGRPALVPPHFLRLAQELGADSNVTFSPAGTTIAKSKQQSLYSRSDFIGRYTFYHQETFSIAPELRFNNTYYFHRVPEVYRNDNYLLAPALRTAYEHQLFKKPASVLFDYDYSEAKRDVRAQKKLEFSSRSHTFMLGERFNFFSSGETIIRLRRRALQSYIPSSNSTTTSLVFEQISSLGTNILLLFASYDRMRVVNNVYDTNSLTFRTDLILARVRDWFTPTVALALTSTDPINNSARGREFLFNPSFRLSKSFRKSWRANFKYDYQHYNSKDVDNFAYVKTLYGLELEYLF